MKQQPRRHRTRHPADGWPMESMSEDRIELKPDTTMNWWGLVAGLIAFTMISVGAISFGFNIPNYVLCIRLDGLSAILQHKPLLEAAIVPCNQSFGILSLEALLFFVGLAVLYVTVRGNRAYRLSNSEITANNLNKYTDE